MTDHEAALTRWLTRAEAQRDEAIKQRDAARAELADLKRAERIRLTDGCESQ